MAQAPRVGVGVFVFRSCTDGSFVLGVRKGSHGAGTYALPGGHLEHGEDFEECAIREVKEETGLTIGDVRFLTATNSVFKETVRHYVTIFMTAVAVSNTPCSPPQALLLEPDKCEGWVWRSFAEMQTMHQQGSELFLPLVSLMEQRSDISKMLELMQVPQKQICS